jgi:hypothetical protein
MSCSVSLSGVILDTAGSAREIRQLTLEGCEDRRNVIEQLRSRQRVARPQRWITLNQNSPREQYGLMPAPQVSSERCKLGSNGSHRVPPVIQADQHRRASLNPSAKISVTAP